MALVFFLGTIRSPSHFPSLGDNCCDAARQGGSLPREKSDESPKLELSLRGTHAFLDHLQAEANAATPWIY